MNLHPRGQEQFKTAPVAQLQHALDLGSEIVERYGLSSLRTLLTSCRSALAQDDITVAIVGRFKAGKSSFINHFIGRFILPVGVVPVTTVVTEIQFGPTERAEGDLKSGLGLILRHEAGGTRATTATLLVTRQRELENRLLATHSPGFPHGPKDWQGPNCWH